MKILINFILKNSLSHISCRFWSCVLETSKELSDKDFTDLNRNLSNKKKLQSYSTLSINAEYSVYNENIVEEFFGKGNTQSRPAIFLPCDNSPYRDRSSYITSYYADEKQFQLELLKCVSIDNVVCSSIDYLSIQKEAILAVKEIIGFDLLKCSSIPGCLSIYKKLPLFDDDDYNFNQKKGPRYIVIKPPLNVPDGFSGEYAATIEALDREKILYRRIVFLSSSCRIDFPSTNELEDFYEIRISICGKTNDGFIPLYEVHHNLMKNYSFNGIVSGGRSRLLVNRYKGKTLDEVAQSDSFGSNDSARNKTDWSDKDYNYRLETKGSPAKYLVSKFFNKTPAGREEFLDWTRNLFQNVKSVTVIDPYFDLNGFHDFLSCVNMPFDLTVLTTDPAKQSRSEDDKAYSDENAKSLANEIFSAFPNAKIYFDGEDSFHDRYFIIDGKRFFSMSNSWNGSVNNFSMFVQELNLECSLKVEESFKHIQDNSVLQVKKQEPVDTSRLEQRKKDIEKYEPLIDSSRDAIKNLAEAGSDEYERIASEYDFDRFYELFCTVFKCHSFGMYKRKDDDHPYTDDVVIEFCSKAIKNICTAFTVSEAATKDADFIEKLVKKTVKALLEDQKNTFIKTKELVGSKSLTVYNTIDKILKRVSQVEFIGNPTYKYDIDYCLYSILKCCFVVAPTLVIKELEKQEKEICKIDIVIKPATETSSAKIKTQPYYESEMILAAMLSQMYELVNVDDIDATIDFILRTESLYCKLYYAMTFIDYRLNINFSNDIQKYLEKLKLSNAELAAVLGELYAYKNSSRASSNEEVTQKQSLLGEILDYSIAKLSVPLSNGDIISDEKILPMLRFVFTAFVFRNTNLNVDLVLEVVKKCENTILEETFCKLLLIHALKKVPNRQLYNFVLENSNLSDEIKNWFFAMQKELPKFSDDYPEMKQPPSIVDMECFINNTPSLGTILSRYYLLDVGNNLRKNVKSEKQLDVLNGILFKIELHLKLLFETSEYIGSIDFDYYVLLIILYSFVDLKEVLNERNASESQKEQVEYRIKEEFEKIEWYFPFVINALSDDFYGLVYEFLDVYLSFKDVSEKKHLFDSIDAPALKVFIGSKIDDFLFENESYSKLFSEVLSNDEFNSFDRSKKIIYLLNIFASVVLCTSDSYKTVANEILDRIISMLSKLDNKKINTYIKLGKVYFDTKTSDSLNEFSAQMDKFYFPISLRAKTNILLQQGAKE